MKKEHYIIFGLVLIIAVGSVVFYYETKGKASPAETQTMLPAQEPLEAESRKEGEANRNKKNGPAVAFEEDNPHTYHPEYPDEFDKPQNYIHLAVKSRNNVGFLSGSGIKVDFDLHSIAREAHYSNVVVNVIWRNSNGDVVSNEKELLKVNLAPGTQQQLSLKKTRPNNGQKIDLEVISADAEI